MSTAAASVRPVLAPRGVRSGVRPLQVRAPAVHRRRRLAALALLVAVVAAAAVLVGSTGGPATAASTRSPADAAAGVLLVVGPGDTVWDLAAPHAPAGTPVNVWVARVLASNGIRSGLVRPGDVLRLPAP